MPTRVKKDVIGLMQCLEGDRELYVKFLSKDNRKELYQFVQAEGFTEISEVQCGDILDIINDKRLNPHLQELKVIATDRNY